MSDARAASEAGPWRSYKERIATLSQRLVEAQRPIRVLDSIRWPAASFDLFRASHFREPPRFGPEEYAKNPIGFDPVAKRHELSELARSIEKDLDASDPIARILLDSTLQYLRVVDMLETRGTPEFHRHSQALYGSSKDCFTDGVTRVRDVALDMYELLNRLDDMVLGRQLPRDVPAERVVQLLNERLAALFGADTVRVILDDGIVADAAAGSDYIKIRQGALFSERDIRVLEVHEGWVHMATSLNGQQQPVARWLAKGPPRTAATQEGLAALLEILAFASHPHRARRLNDRVLAVDKAEDGASFLDVFEWFRMEGYDEGTCFWSTNRVFRGGVIDGGAPFTKDTVYTRGLVDTYNFLQGAIASGRPDVIRWLFVGKVALEDVPILAHRAHEGLVRAPRFLPAIFEDLNGLAIWLGVSTFSARLNNRAILQHFEELFRDS